MGRHNLDMGSRFVATGWFFFIQKKRPQRESAEAPRQNKAKRTD
jgi:hypothetical protein